MKNKHYYIETDFGCSITVAESLDDASKKALAYEGSNHLKKVREATKEDIGWISCMGGRIPMLSP